MSAASTIAIAGSSRKAPSLSDHQVDEIAGGTSAEIAQWVLSTAEERGVSIRDTPSARFARAASRLSDAETDLDQVEELLIALDRAHVITSYQRGLLHVHYLRGQMRQTL